MSTRVNGRHTEDLDAGTDLICRFPFCGRGVTRRFRNEGIHLCQDHALHTWATIQAMLADGEMSTPQPRPVHQFDGYVYYIRVGDRIKIGHSTDIDRRLSTYPPGMEILLIRKGDRQLETAEHRRFGAYRTDGREWFAATEQVLELIAETKATVWHVTGEFDESDFERRRHEPQQVRHRKLPGYAQR